MQAIQKSIQLISRVEVPPTLSGVGTVYDHFELLHEIGTARFGIVRKAVSRRNREFYAVKVINKSKAVRSRGDAMRLQHEIKIMRKAARDVSTG